MDLFTTYYHSPVGLLKLQCTEHEVRTVVFSDNLEEPVQTQSHFLLHQCREELDAYFAGSRKEFSLPFNQEGTVFQKKVWGLLSGITYGRTISYHQLAKWYGDVKAIRAAASANGKNNLAIIVPCHRVIGSDQSLTGYAGGLWRKRWLLAHEARHQLGVRELF